MNHLYILGCIFFTVLGQIIAKWRMNIHGCNIPDTFKEKVHFYIFTLLVDPYIIATYFCGLVASLFWIMAISKFDLSYAYPFMSVAFVLVLILSSVFFHENITLYKIIGTLFIITGIFIVYKGK